MEGELKAAELRFPALPGVAGALAHDLPTPAEEGEGGSGKGAAAPPSARHTGM